MQRSIKNYLSIVLILCSFTVFGQSDVFMRVDGVQGTSEDDKHKNWSELTTFSFGVESDEGKPQSEVMSIVKKVDLASPQLMELVTERAPTKQVIIVAHRAGGEKQEFMRIVLTNVRFTKYSTSVDSDNIPDESIEMTYESIRYTVTEPGSKGTSERKRAFGWNFLQNKKE